jgi:hypothetical protein
LALFFQHLGQEIAEGRDLDLLGIVIDGGDVFFAAVPASENSDPKLLSGFKPGGDDGPLRGGGNSLESGAGKSGSGWRDDISLEE